MENDMLIPYIGVITDIRDETGDVKTFRVVGRDGKKLFYHKPDLKEGKSRKVSRKLYPSYVLVEMVLDEQSWYVVRHTPGVTGFVGAGSLPLPLSEREVRDLMARIGVDQVKPKIELDLKLGDTVCVKNGAFAGQTGPVVELIPEKGKVKFTVTVFGRETLVEADYQDLEKV